MDNAGLTIRGLQTQFISPNSKITASQPNNNKNNNNSHFIVQ